MSILRGEIYLTDLGKGKGSEHSGTKYCLIVQNNTGNRYSQTTTVIPITSEFKNQKTHVLIENILEKPSWVRCEQIRTIDKSRLIAKAAYLPKTQMERVERTLIMQLGIGGVVK